MNGDNVFPSGKGGKQVMPPLPLSIGISDGVKTATSSSESHLSGSSGGADRQRHVALQG